MELVFYCPFPLPLYSFDLHYDSIYKSIWTHNAIRGCFRFEYDCVPSLT